MVGLTDDLELGDCALNRAITLGGFEDGLCVVYPECFRLTKTIRDVKPISQPAITALTSLGLCWLLEIHTRLSLLPRSGFELTANRSRMLNIIESLEESSPLNSTSTTLTTLMAAMDYATFSLIEASDELLLNNMDNVKQSRRMNEINLSFMQSILIKIRDCFCLHSSNAMNPELLHTLIITALSFERVRQARHLKTSLEERKLSECTDFLYDEVFAKWFANANSITKKWLLKTVLSEIRGLPALERVRLRVLETAGESVFDCLNGREAGISWSVIRSTTMPPLIPHHAVIHSRANSIARPVTQRNRRPSSWIKSTWMKYVCMQGSQQPSYSERFHFIIC